MAKVPILLLTLFVLVWIYLGWNFPGHCRNYEGLRCADPGIIGLADHILGFKSGGSMAGVALLLFIPIFIFVFFVLSVFISVIGSLTKFGSSASYLVLMGLALGAFIWASQVTWEPHFSPGAREWYGPGEVP